MKRPAALPLALLLTLLLCLTGLAGCRETGEAETDTGLTGVYSRSPAGLEREGDFSNSILDMTVSDGRLYVLFLHMTELAGGYELCAIDPDGAEPVFRELPRLDGRQYVSLAVSDGKAFLLAAPSAGNNDSGAILCVDTESGERLWNWELGETAELPRMAYQGYHAARGSDSWCIAFDRTLLRFSDRGQLLDSDTLPGTATRMQRDAAGRLHIWCGWGFEQKTHLVSGDGGDLNRDALWGDDAAAFFCAEAFGGAEEAYLGCYADPSGLHLRGADGKNVFLCDWLSCGLLFPDVGDVAAISPQTIYVAASDSEEGDSASPRLWRLEMTPASALTDVRLLHISCSADCLSSVGAAALRFNRSQSEYRAVCSVLDSGGYFDALDGAILDGSVGDIVITPNPSALQKYADKGLFADLYTLDSHIADDVPGCVRRASEQDGHLYGLPLQMTLELYAMPRGLLPEDGVWDLEALLDLAETVPDGQRLLLSMDRSSFSRALTASVLEACVDLDAGSCSFEDGLFARYLSLLSTLPDENPAVMLEPGQNPYYDGEVLLLSRTLYSWMDYARLISGGYFGADTPVTLEGFPSSGGGAAKLSPHVFCSIRASGQTDGALTYLKTLLSNDFLSDPGYDELPMLRSGYADLKNGADVGRYLIFAYHDLSRLSVNANPVDLPDTACVQITPALFDDLLDFLDSVPTLPLMPDAITAIYEEDVSAFLSGAKDASETARLLQNRIGTYLSEQQ